MRATVMHSAGDVRIENVPEAGDVVVAPFAYSDGMCVFCHEGLHPSCFHGGFWGLDGVDGGQGEAVRVPLGGVAPARAYIEELLPDVLDGKIEPGRVFDRVASLDEVPDGYRAMDDREAIKVLIDL